MRRRVFGPLLLTASMVLAGASTALAVPVLQLDIAGGTYDAETETIVASSNPFTLIALATPQGTMSADAILSQTFYLSMAVSPITPPPGADLGYVTINGQRINVTQDMTYGKPPIEVIDELQGSDPGDLPGHGIYPTYFAEHAFEFSPTATALEYNTAERAINGGAGLTPTQGGTSFFQQFVVDTSTLHPDYVIHFDLYNASVRRCGRQEQQLSGSDPSCVDIDANGFAPFSHDAQSPPVPEPATMLLLGTGVAAGALRRFRRREAL